jgi:hypothetical protein
MMLEKHRGFEKIPRRRDKIGLDEYEPRVKSLADSPVKERYCKVGDGSDELENNQLQRTQWRPVDRGSCALRHTLELPSDS